MKDSITKGDEVPAQNAKKDKWQERLLPLMVSMIVGLTVFFFVATCVQLVYVQLNIKSRPKIEMDEYTSLFPDKAEGTPEEVKSVAKLKSFLILEANSLEGQHHHINIAFMSRLWIRYVGFVTGMILSLVGATFILGKIHTSSSELKTKLEAAEFSFKSASPGLILSLLGVILMLTTIITHHQIEWTDRPVYFGGMKNNEIKDSNIPDPGPLKPPPKNKEEFLTEPTENSDSNNID